MASPSGFAPTSLVGTSEYALRLFPLLCGIGSVFIFWIQNFKNWSPSVVLTFIGSLVGFGDAFAVGYVGGYLVARIYNRIADRREASLDRRKPTP